MGELEENVWVSRSGTLLISPSLIGPTPLGPLLQIFEAEPQLPGLLAHALKETLQGQAPGRGLGCPLSLGWALLSVLLSCCCCSSC